MENLILIVWILWIAVEVFFNWYQIEVIKEEIVHWKWIIPRGAVGLMMLYWIVQVGFMWYWGALFLLTTHALLFPEGLNKVRGRRFGYLGDPDPNSSNKSKYDAFLQRNKNIEMPWLVFRVIFAIWGVGQILICGMCSWEDLMNGIW